MKPIIVGEPKPNADLRAVDFAWQAFQEGLRMGRRGMDGTSMISHEHFVQWWNAHPQVVVKP